MEQSSQHSTSTEMPTPGHLVAHEPGGFRYTSPLFGAYSIFLRGRARWPHQR
jgi:hypothetical protein